MTDPEDTTRDRSNSDRGAGGGGTENRHRIEHDGGADRLLTGDDPMDARLPADLQRAFGAMLNGESADTVGEWTAELRRHLDGGGVDVEDLCHADEETPHRGTMDGETYHFLCFYDAVVLSALAEQPVDIRTASPEGTVVEARADGPDGLSVSPESAVFSLGVTTAATDSAEGSLSPADLYEAVCPYVKAFPDADSYRQWADTVEAPTVALPLAGATELAAALLGPAEQAG